MDLWAINIMSLRDRRNRTFVMKNIMMAWTLLIVAGIVVNLMFGSFYAMPGTLPTNTP